MAGIVLIVGGLVVCGIALAGRAGKLPRNHFAGIRLPSTMKSDEAWVAAHRVSWLYTFAAGVLMIALGTMAVIDPDRPKPFWLLPLVILVPVLLGAVRANAAARSVDD